MSMTAAGVLGGSIEDYRAPLFIAWQINSECPLNCLHCCEEAGHPFPDAMTRDQTLEACRQFVAAGVPYVAISGGEPLLSPYFWEVCEYLRGHGVDVKVETNGELIDGPAARRLAGLRLRSVQVSVDGAAAVTHEALRERGDFSLVMRACRALRDEGANIEVVFVPTRFNVHEAGAVVDLAASLGAYGFYTGKLMRIGRAARNWNTLCPTDEQYEKFFAVLREKTAQYAGRMKVYYYPYDVIEELRVRLESPSASLLVIPNGKVKLIGPLPFICGDLRRATLDTVWERYKQGWKDPRVVGFARRVLAEPARVAQANDWIEL